MDIGQRTSSWIKSASTASVAKVLAAALETGISIKHPMRCTCIQCPQEMESILNHIRSVMRNTLEVLAKIGILRPKISLDKNTLKASRDPKLESKVRKYMNFF